MCPGTPFFATLDDSPPKKIAWKLLKIAVQMVVDQYIFAKISALALSANIESLDIVST